MLWQCHASGICCAFGRCYKRFHNRHDLLKTVATINSKTNNTSSTLLKCSKYIISFAENQTLIRQSRRSGFKLRFSFRDPKISSTCSISYADEKRAACKMMVRAWTLWPHAVEFVENSKQLGFWGNGKQDGFASSYYFNDFQFRGVIWLDSSMAGQCITWVQRTPGSTSPATNGNRHFCCPVQAQKSVLCKNHLHPFAVLHPSSRFCTCPVHVDESCQTQLTEHEFRTWKTCEPMWSSVSTLSRFLV